MPHIHTNPGAHDSTVTAFIIRTGQDIPRLLVHRHKKLDLLLPPGGHVELTETPWDAIRHEVTEETGYALTQLRLLQPSSRLREPFTDDAILHPQPAAYVTHLFDAASQHYHTDASFAFITNEDPSGNPDDGESIDFRWLDLYELARLTSEIPQNVRAIGEFVLTTVFSEWEAVDLTTYR